MGIGTHGNGSLPPRRTATYFPCWIQAAFLSFSPSLSICGHQARHQGSFGIQAFLSSLCLWLHLTEGSRPPPSQTAMAARVLSAFLQLPATHRARGSKALVGEGREGNSRQWHQKLPFPLPEFGGQSLVFPSIWEGVGTAVAGPQPFGTDSTWRIEI